MEESQTTYLRWHPVILCSKGMLMDKLHTIHYQTAVSLRN